MSGKFAQPPSQAAQQAAYANAGYDAMLRRMNVGSITAGTPLPLPIPGMPGAGMSSLAGSASSSRKDGTQSALDMQKAAVTSAASMLPRGPGSFYDPALIEHYYKRNATSSPNAQQTAALVSASYGHRPFSPNFAFSLPPGVLPPGIGSKGAPITSSAAAVISSAAATAAAKDAIANQLLIDYNTSKQMQSRRSSASSEKEQQQEAAMLMKHRPPSHGQGPHHFHVAPSPSPNSQMYERGVIRGEESSTRTPPAGMPPLPPGMLVGLPAGFPSDSVLSQWQNLTNLQYSLVGSFNYLP